MTEGAAYPLDSWAYRSSPPLVKGRVRCESADFTVREELGFELEGKGKHLWVYIEKTDLNTVDVSRGLARAAGIHQKEIGFSGLKDRKAVTSQWFSVLAELDSKDCFQRVSDYCAQQEGIRLLEANYHGGKLRKGSHKFNHFQLRIRELSGESSELENRLEQIQTNGVPNYFGPQRFGRNGKNTVTAQRWFTGDVKRLDRLARSMALSSARSWIFNQVVSERLQRPALRSPQIGDLLMLDGTQSWFLNDGSDRHILDRWNSGDVHITAPMWGAGDLETESHVKEFEEAVVSEIETLPRGLEQHGLRQQRRAMTIVPKGMKWQFMNGNTLQLQFALQKGGFATAVLRELINFYE
ncbi:MAG: tRNA pseudouridine(13) synthase TruD [Acidiferrobacterales bacterium]|nr:tRNA pseudouridine(13) synthase TruD [Acidiferrobacterales bacterium]